MTSQSLFVQHLILPPSPSLSWPWLWFRSWANREFWKMIAWGIQAATPDTRSRHSLRQPKKCSGRRAWGPKCSDNARREGPQTWNRSHSPLCTGWRRWTRCGPTRAKGSRGKGNDRMLLKGDSCWELLLNSKKCQWVSSPKNDKRTESNQWSLGSRGCLSGKWWSALGCRLAEKVTERVVASWTHPEDWSEASGGSYRIPSDRCLSHHSSVWSHCGTVAD